VGFQTDRAQADQMAGCLIAVLTYIPIYKAMERYAGNNVETVKSAKNKVTAPSLSHH